MLKNKEIALIGLYFDKLSVRYYEASFFVLT